MIEPIRRVLGPAGSVDRAQALMGARRVDPRPPRDQRERPGDEERRRRKPVPPETPEGEGPPPRIDVRA